MVIVLYNVFIVIASVSAAVLFLFLVTRTSTAPSRRESNDFTGAVVAVIGTTYAVILAFTLSGVWSMFQQAQANEEQEANALVNVFRIATELKDPNAKQIQDVCVRYVDNTLVREWPLMEKGQMTPEGAEMIDQLWKLAGESQAHAQTRRHRGLSTNGGVARIDPIQAASGHGKPRAPSRNTLGGANCRRPHYRRRILFLWSAQLPLSLGAGSDAHLLDFACASRHREHRPAVPGVGESGARRV